MDGSCAPIPSWRSIDPSLGQKTLHPGARPISAMATRRVVNSPPVGIDCSDRDTKLLADILALPPQVIQHGHASLAASNATLSVEKDNGRL